MIDLIFRNSTSDKKYGSKLFEKVLETVVNELELKNDFSLSVNLTVESKMRELNKKHRNKNQPTDVLSFPTNEKSEIHNPKFVIQDIGDIFICLSIAKNEAKRENIDTEYKLAQLTTHGFLHLLGYDHEKSVQDADKMFKTEARILNKLG